MARILEQPNPTVVLMALEQMTVQWKPAYLESVLSCMKHDDETVRWQATEALMKNVNRSFDETLQALLQDFDLRRRGLAAYIAVHFWKQNSFPFLRIMLREEAQLLRFDAISAIIKGGGEEGFKIITEHRRNESDSTLKQMIDKSRERP
jgi:HEAT repeat protein